MPEIEGRLLLKSGAIAVALSVLTFWALDLYRLNPSIAHEHGPMENCQAALLGIGVLLFGFFAVGARNAGERCFLAGASLFYLTFLLLEYDVRPFKKPILTLLLNGAVRNAWVAAGWLALGWLVWRNTSSLWEAAQRWRRSFPAALLIAAGPFWMIAAASEKLGWSGSNTFFMEELFESHAAILMALSAVFGRTPFAVPLPAATGQPQETAAKGSVEL